MQERRFFELKINISEDDYIRIGERCAGIYECELVIDEKNNNDIKIKIFFNDKECLGDKLGHYAHDRSYNILDKFEITKIIYPERLHAIEINNTKINGFETSSDFYEQGMRYFIIGLNSILLIFNNDDQADNLIYLNQESFKLIELNYSYNFNFHWLDKQYEYKPTNKIDRYIIFGEIEFKPEFNFYNSSGNDGLDVIIKKEPRFRVKYTEKHIDIINRHIKLLCLLYSFYSHKNIKYSFSKIYSTDKLDIRINKVEINSFEDEHGVFRWDFFSNPLNLITNVDVNKLIYNLDFVELIVTRYNQALQVDGESRFMILYNLLERIRNKYILDSESSLTKVSEEYRFDCSKSKRDSLIKNSLENLIPYVNEVDRELFTKEIKYKVTPIKLLSMTNQFKSFFDYLNINSIEYGLDFIKLKSLRDTIFHGNTLEISHYHFLSDINSYKMLPRFVGVVILKFMGISDISTIKRNNFIS